LLDDGDDDDDDDDDDDNEEDEGEGWENEDYGEDYDFDEIDDLINSLDSTTKLDPNKNYVMWEGGGCDTCATLNGQIFEEASAPEEPHPNCKCTLTPVDANGNKTGEPRKPKPKKQKPKCSRITSPKQNNRFHPHDKKPKPHDGTDFGIPNKTPIKSPVSGKVTRNSDAGKLGNTLTITDKDGIEHHFAHLDSLSNLKPGEDMVEKGDHIGNSGNSGDTSDGKPYAPHLHYETRDSKIPGNWKDKVVDPKQEDLDYLDKQFIDLLGCK